MRKYSLSPAAKNIICAAIFLLALGATFLAQAYLTSVKHFKYAVIALVWITAFLYGALLIPFYFRRTVIYISGAEITVHSGLLYLRRDHMKTSAVQYVTMMTLPLSGITGFNFIGIKALGGSILLPFLRWADCQEIVNTLHLEVQKRAEK